MGPADTLAALVLEALAWWCLLLTVLGAVVFALYGIRPNL
jgi:hypothetical protein